MPSETVFRRGDLVVGVFGGDFGKPRPAVVVQSDYFLEKHSTIVLCPVTSDLKDIPYFRVPLSAKETPGIRKDSEVMVDKLRAIERRRVGKRVGSLSARQMAAVDVALARWLGLSEEPGWN